MDKEQLKRLLKYIKEYEAPISTFLGMLVVVISVGIMLFAVTVFRKNTDVYEKPFSVPSAFEFPSTPKVVTELPDSIVVYEKDNQYYVEGLPVIYVVLPGDTIESIAEAFYKSSENVIDIFRENKIDSGSAVIAGQELIIPDVPTKLSKQIIEKEKK